MKSNYTSIVAVLVTVTLIGSIGATTLLLQLAQDFRSLTHDFEKAVLDVVTFTGPE
jgi:hypothetical protein